MVVLHTAFAVLIGLAVGSLALLVIGAHHVRRSGVLCVAGVPIDAGLGALLVGLGIRFGTPFLVAGSLILGSYVYAVVTMWVDRRFDMIGASIADVVHDLDPGNEGVRFTDVLLDRRLRWVEKLPNLFDFIMDRSLGRAGRTPILTMWTAPDYNVGMEAEDSEPPSVVMIALATGEHMRRVALLAPKVEVEIVSETPTPSDDTPIEVGPDHPAWASIDDDDWNGSTYVMWLATLKGKKVVLRPPANAREGLVQDMIANLRVGGVEWDLPA